MSTWNGAYVDIYWTLIDKQIFCLIPQNFASRHFLNLKIFLIKSSSAILGIFGGALHRHFEIWESRLKIFLEWQFNQQNFRQQMALFFHKENNAICCPTAIPQTYASKLLPTITLKSLFQHFFHLSRLKVLLKYNFWHEIEK